MQDIPVISIVDDDGSVRLATESLVRSLGYVVHTFASATNFLQSPHLDETACVIADVQMPGMSGVDLQATLRQRGYRTPIIFMTAYPEGRIRDRALQAGAVCFLSKPFDARTMIDCLRTALERDIGGTSEG